MRAYSRMAFLFGGILDQGSNFRFALLLSQGEHVDLVRGICCLKAAVPSLSLFSFECEHHRMSDSEHQRWTRRRKVTKDGKLPTRQCSFPFVPGDRAAIAKHMDFGQRPLGCLHDA